MGILIKIKDILIKRGISTCFSVVAFVASIVTLCMYRKAGINEFVAKLDDGVLTLLTLSIVFSAVFSVVEVKMGKYATYLIMLAGWLMFITSQINYLTNILVGIDGNTLTADFILTAVFGAIAWIFMLVSAILQRSEIGYECRKKMQNDKKVQEATNE